MSYRMHSYLNGCSGEKAHARIYLAFRTRPSSLQDGHREVSPATPCKSDMSSLSGGRKQTCSTFAETHEAR